MAWGERGPVGNEERSCPQAPSPPRPFTPAAKHHRTEGECPSGHLRSRRPVTCPPLAHPYSTVVPTDYRIRAAGAGEPAGNWTPRCPQGLPTPPCEPLKRSTAQCFG